MLGDVGVRFGGSEHHRIGTSSSHTRPPPFGVGIPGQRDRAAGALRRTGQLVSRERQAARFGALATLPRDSVVRPLRRASGTVPPGSGTRRSSEHRAPNLTGVRQAARFGAPGVRPHRDREPAALRGRRHPTSRDREPAALRGQRHPTPPGHSKRHSSEGRARRLTGTGKPHLFGGAVTRFHRPGILRPRSGQGPNPPGIGTRRLSGHRLPHLTGQGNRALRSTATSLQRERQAARFGAQATLPGNGKQCASARRLPSHGTGQPELFGAPASQFHGTGNQRLFGAEGTPPHGTGNQRLFGAEGTPPHRGTANGTLRRVGRSASPEQGNRASSEDRQTSSNRVWENAPPHWDRATEALRSPARSFSTGSPPTGQGKQHPSGRWALRLNGHGKRRASAQRASRFVGKGPTVDPRTPGSSEQEGTGTDPQPLGAGWPGSPRQGTADVRRALRHAAIGKDTDLGRELRRAGR